MQSVYLYEYMLSVCRAYVIIISKSNFLSRSSWRSISNVFVSLLLSVSLHRMLRCAVLIDDEYFFLWSYKKMEWSHKPFWSLHLINEYFHNQENDENVCLSPNQNDYFKECFFFSSSFQRKIKSIWSHCQRCKMYFNGLFFRCHTHAHTHTSQNLMRFLQSLKWLFLLLFLLTF